MYLCMCVYTNVKLFYKGAKGVFGYFNNVCAEHCAFKDVFSSFLLYK